MSNFSPRWRGLLAAAVACAALAAPAHALDLPGPLVAADWLAAHRAEVQVVEVRSDVGSFNTPPVFETDKKTGARTLVEVGGHLPGARTVDFKAVRTDRMIDGIKVKHMAPDAAEFQARMRAAGVMADKPIVLVPVGQAISDVDEALRLYWTFKLYGEDRVAVLDGGAAGWLAEGREVSTAAPTPQAGDWQAGAERPALLATSGQVAQAIERHSAQLVDARPLPQFHGLSKSDAVSAFGHLQGAASLPPELLTRARAGALYFHPAATYRALFKARGMDADAPSVAYCNTGHLASGAWFVMHELMGNQRTQLYDGSMHEWTLEGRSVVGLQ